jgi:hypothetical protein
MITRSLILGVAITCVAILAGGAQPGAPAGDPSSSAPVAVSIKTDKKSYGPKDPIKLTMTVKNPGKSPVRLMFTSGMKYDLEIRKGKTRNGASMWQWSRGRMFTQMISNTTLDAGKTLTFAEAYAPGERGADGKPGPELEPGTYTATAVLATSGRTPRPMASTMFTVK